VTRIRTGLAEERSIFAEGLNEPFGIAFWHDFVYVGNTDAVTRYRYKPGQMKAEGPAEKIADLRAKVTANTGRETFVQSRWEEDVCHRRLGIKRGRRANPMRATITEFNPDEPVNAPTSAAHAIR